MVTPFASSGAVDYDVASKLAKFLVAEGSDGLVVGGSTGEGSSLSDEEKLDLFACVAEAVTVPVLAGSTFANTQQSIVLTAQAISSTAGTLTGTVNFLDGTTVIATVPLGANGQATYSVATLAGDFFLPGLRGFGGFGGFVFSQHFRKHIEIVDIAEEVLETLEIFGPRGGMFWEETFEGVAESF